MERPTILNSKKRLPSRAKLPLGAFATTLALSLASCTGASTNPEAYTPTPPEGFSRNPEDYEWQIRVDIEENKNGPNYAQLFTNEKPVLLSQEGVSHVIAKDVWCPEFSRFKDKVGCIVEFMREWELSSPKRISVSDNQGIR